MVTLFALSDGVTVTEPSSLALILGCGTLVFALSDAGTLSSRPGSVCVALTSEPSVTLSDEMVTVPLSLSRLTPFGRLASAVQAPLSLAMVAVFDLPSASV